MVTRKVMPVTSDCRKLQLDKCQQVSTTMLPVIIFGSLLVLVDRRSWLCEPINEQSV